MRISAITAAACLTISASSLFAQPAPMAGATMSGPYKVLKAEKVGGEGGFDYVFADSDSRKLFVVRSGRPGGRADAYDLDSLKLVGSISDVNGGHGVAVDPKTGHGFTSSSPVVMFDTKALTTTKTIPVEGRPDGIFFEPSTEHIFVLSHSAPNVSVINGDDGALVGTIDLGGAPEQGVSDGKGHAYICIEDKDKIGVVDVATNKVTGTYDLSEKGKTPAGLALDVKNNILFAYCRNPAVCVIMNAADGKVLATLPTGNGVDAAEFNPDTMEAFSSHGEGVLTIIKENSPTDFVVEQTVPTKQGGKCSSLDSKTGNVYITSAERAQASQPAANAGGGGGQGGGGQGGNGQRRGGAAVPGSFTITVVGK